MSSSAVWLIAAVASPTALATTTLKYFNARGVVENTRVMFAIGDIEYDDRRYAIGPGFEAPEFKAEKESGALALNLNRAPLLITGEGIIGQSKAIERYVAKRAGLMGKSPFEAATIDMLAEHVRDVRDAQARKGFSPMARDKTDEEKTVLADEWYSTDLPDWLGRIEACIIELSGQDASHACGGCLSYADVCIWSLLREGAAADVERIAKASAACTTLNCIADTVSTHPKVAAWVASRPETAF